MPIPDFALQLPLHLTVAQAPTLLPPSAAFAVSVMLYTEQWPGTPGRALTARLWPLHGCQLWFPNILMCALLHPALPTGAQESLHSVALKTKLLPSAALGSSQKTSSSHSHLYFD